MIKVVISLLNLKAWHNLPVVWFWAEEYDWKDFSTFIDYVRKLRAAEPKIIYDFNLKKNYVETEVPDKMIDYLKKLFESKAEMFSWVEVIIRDEYSGQKLEENLVVIDTNDIEKDFESLYWAMINKDYQLRKHQYEALEFFRERRRVYLAYEPWTWKSLIYFSALTYDSYFNWTKNVLVISPAKYNAHVNLFKEFESYQWERKTNVTFLYWNKSAAFEEFEENYKKSWVNVMLTSYETLRVQNTFEQIMKYKFDLIICDEAKALISWSSAQSECVREIIETNWNCWVIFWEWTPIRWFADDLWNPLDLLQPKKWWNFYVFRDKYCFTKTVNFWKFPTIVVTWVKNTEELHKRVWEVMLTKKLNELSDIPDVQFTKISVWLSNKHKKLLSRIQEDFIEWYKEFKKNKWAWTRLEKDEEQLKRVQIMKLYQASTMPINLDETFDPNDIEWLTVLKEYIDEVVLQRWKKVVIFTYFRKSAEMIEEAIKELKTFKKNKYSLVNYLWWNKLEMKTKFQEDENCKIFISTIWSWWEAITLTAADSVLFYEKPLTWAETFQAIRRVQRIWQKANKVNVVSIVPEWTILEWIEKRLEKKRKSLEKIIDWKEDFIEEDIVNWLDEIINWIDNWV